MLKVLLGCIIFMMIQHGVPGTYYRGAYTLTIEQNVETGIERRYVDGEYVPPSLSINRLNKVHKHGRHINFITSELWDF